MRTKRKTTSYLISLRSRARKCWTACTPKHYGLVIYRDVREFVKPTLWNFKQDARYDPTYADLFRSRPHRFVLPLCAIGKKGDNLVTLKDSKATASLEKTSVSPDDCSFTIFKNWPNFVLDFEGDSNSVSRARTLGRHRMWSTTNQLRLLQRSAVQVLLRNPHWRRWPLSWFCKYLVW